MAGMGPPPKNPASRARRNKDAVALRVVEITAASRPDLPEFEVEVKVDGDLMMVPFRWPAATRDWWAMLERHPLVGEFTELDWSYLMETARIHAAFWLGSLQLASELRLREAKYGFTPEDRARLRIQFAQAAEAEVDASRKVESARDRMRNVRPA